MMTIWMQWRVYTKVSYQVRSIQDVEVFDMWVGSFIICCKLNCAVTFSILFPSCLFLSWEYQFFDLVFKSPINTIRNGPGLSSTSALNKIKRPCNHGSDHIVMIVTRKDSVWKCLVLLYQLDFNVRNTVMSNTNKRLMLKNGKAQFKNKVFWHGRLKKRADLW